MVEGTYILLSKILGGAAGITVVLAITIPWAKQKVYKHRLCPKCRYDLSHTPGLRCSECGHVAKRESKLRKPTRPHLAVAFAMLLASGGYAAMVTPAVKVRGWPAAVPTTAMIATLPVLRPDHNLYLRHGLLPSLQGKPAPCDEPRTRLFIELVQVRLQDGRVRPWQDAMLTLVCNAMNDVAADDTDPWASRSDMVVGTVRWANDYTIEWHTSAIADETLPSLVRTRTVWPRGTTVMARWDPDDQAKGFTIDSYAGRGGRIDLVAQSDNAMDWSSPQQEMNVLFCGNGAPPSLWDDRMFPIGYADGLPIDFELTGRRSYSWMLLSRLTAIPTQPLKLNLAVTPSVDDILQPVADAQAEQRMKDHFRPLLNHRVFLFEDSMSYGLNIVGNNRQVFDHLPHDEQPTFAFEATIYIDDVPVGTAHAWYTSSPYNRLMGAAHVPVNITDQETFLNRSSGSEIKVTIRGDGLTALRNFDATSYWSGEITLPLQITSDDPFRIR